MGAQVIAIDGPAASGKSTIAAGVARRLHIPYVNTGNMYRAVTLHVLRCGVDPLDRQAVAGLLPEIVLDYRPDVDGNYEIYLNGAAPGGAIRAPEVTAAVSPLSAIPEVRAYLLDKQRSFAGFGLIVMEGRDIGTVIFPDADYKFFLTATPEARARRRLAQGGETPDGATVQSVAAEIAERDRRDSSRVIAPLKQAQDAILIDSSDLTVEQVLELIIEQVTKHAPGN